MYKLITLISPIANHAVKECGTAYHIARRHPVKHCMLVVSMNMAGAPFQFKFKALYPLKVKFIVKAVLFKNAKADETEHSVLHRFCLHCSCWSCEF